MKDEPRVWVLHDGGNGQHFIRTAFHLLLPPVEVRSLYSGGELLRCLKEAQILPQLVLLDLNTPSVSGFDVLPQLRVTKAYEQIPVIVVNTSTDQAYRKKAIESGATSLLSVPPRFVDFFTLIQRLDNWFLLKLLVMETVFISSNLFDQPSVSLYHQLNYS